MPVKMCKTQYLLVLFWLAILDDIALISSLEIEPNPVYFHPFVFLPFLGANLSKYNSISIQGGRVKALLNSN